MNLILIENNDVTENGLVRISGRRLKHITSVHRAKEGDKLKVGIINGKYGTGTVVNINKASMEMQVSLTKDPPKPLPVTLFISLPRPKTIKKVIPAVVSMGVKEIFLVNSYRVEKSYWQSPVISDEKLKELSYLGLEQGFDTILPSIQKKKLFKPFVEDELPKLIENRTAYVPHPYCDNKLTPAVPKKEYALFIGPEGGLISYEVEMLKSSGFMPVNMGERILRVENATVAALAKLF